VKKAGSGETRDERKPKASSSWLGALSVLTRRREGKAAGHGGGSREDCIRVPDERVERNTERKKIGRKNTQAPLAAIDPECYLGGAAEAVLKSSCTESLSSVGLQA